jgi:endoglycosylceramidase
LTEHRIRARSPARAALLGLAIALLASACSSSPKAASEPLPLLGHEGRWITDPAGRVVVLHGVNVVNKNPPYLPSALGFGPEDAQFLAAHGFRAVRVGMIWKAVEPRPGAYDDRYLEQIKATVSMLADVGIYSLLDFHQDALNEQFGGEGLPDWAVAGSGEPRLRGDAGEQALWRALDAFWSNAPGGGGVGVQDRFAAAWSHVARRFLHDDDVLGYDLYNEPLHNGRCVNALACAQFDGDVGVFYERLVRAIRQVDRHHLIWYEPDTLFNWAVPTALPPLEDGNAGMAFHVYCPPPLINSLSCRESAGMVFDNADARSSAEGDALLLGEFGDPSGDVLGMVADTADAHAVSWLMWAYCGCNNPTYPFPVSVHVDDLVIDATKPPGGNNVEQAKLEALVRPHPTLVSGTPERFRFDRRTKEFDFRYRTDRVDGRGAFGDGACSEVFVPRLQYPDGYKAEVHGAEVVSDEGSATLALEAHAPTVTVRIIPTSSGSTEEPRRDGGCPGPSDGAP